jgi:hypothetical protein
VRVSYPYTALEGITPFKIELNTRLLLEKRMRALHEELEHLWMNL